MDKIFSWLYMFFNYFFFKYMTLGDFIDFYLLHTSIKYKGISLGESGSNQGLKIHFMHLNLKYLSGVRCQVLVLHNFFPLYINVM